VTLPEQDSEFSENVQNPHDGSHLHQALAIEELVRANANSNDTMIRLVQSVRDETKARDRKVDALEQSQKQMRVLTVVGIVAIFFLIAMAIFNATNVMATRDASHKVEQTNDLLLDCLNQQGDCGKWNARQQMYLLDEVKKYELTGFYCIRNNPADKDPKADAFLDCMNNLYPGGPQLQKP
jgi:hypothetical protein